MIMSHAFWERHELGAVNKINDSSGSPVKHNPFLTRENTAPGGRRGATIDAFLESGGIVLACNYAFGLLVPDYTVIGTHAVPAPGALAWHSVARALAGGVRAPGEVDVVGEEA